MTAINIETITSNLERIITEYTEAKQLKDTDLMDNLEIEFTDWLASIVTLPEGDHYFGILIEVFGYDVDEALDFYEAFSFAE